MRCRRCWRAGHPGRPSASPTTRSPRRDPQAPAGHEVVVAGHGPSLAAADAARPEPTATASVASARDPSYQDRRHHRSGIRLGGDAHGAHRGGRRRVSARPRPRHHRRAPRPASPASAEVGRQLGARSPSSATSPGPRSAWARGRGRGDLFLAEGQRLEVSARDRTDHARDASTSTTTTWSRTSTSATRWCWATAASGSSRSRSAPTIWWSRSNTAAASRAGPGVTLPSGRLRVAVPTDRDIELIDALAAELDFIAASFVRSAAEVGRGRRPAQATRRSWPRSRPRRRSTPSTRSSTCPTR